MGHNCNNLDIHVLLVPSWYPTATNAVAGVFVKHQAIALKKAGAKVGIIYSHFRSLREFNFSALTDNHFQISFSEEDDIPTLRFCGWNIPRLRLEPILWKCQNERLFRRYIRHFGKPDLIHAHSVLWGGVAAMGIAQHWDIPYIVTEHASSFARGLIQSWQEPIIRRVIKNANYVLSVSKGLADLLIPYADGKKIEVVPNVVDTDFFKLPTIQRKASPFRLLTVAMLTPKKGIDVLLKAFARAFKRTDEVILEIGGDGEQRTELQSLARSLNIENQVKFLGLLSREQVREAMWRANVFVLPSYFETFGVVLVEAMATGLFVIATNCGGPEEFIKPDNGSLLEPGDVGELSKALKNVYDRRFELGKKEKEIRKYIVDNYSNRVIAEKLLKYYSRVLSAQYGNIGV